MFERFTDRARRVVVLAQEEARMLNHNYIGTEHILLGLIHEGEGVAAKALDSLDISMDGVRSQVETIIGRGLQPQGGHIPYTPRGKKVLELSLREALQLGHNYIGTEHILLGLIREGEGVGAQILVKHGAELTRVRQAVIKLLSEHRASEKVPEQGWPTFEPEQYACPSVTIVGGGGAGASGFAKDDADAANTANRAAALAMTSSAERRLDFEKIKNQVTNNATDLGEFGKMIPIRYVFNILDDVEQQLRGR
jgi:ATP-dependent Clp protease ATP-binding subunit ClpC